MFFRQLTPTAVKRATLKLLANVQLLGQPSMTLLTCQRRRTGNLVNEDSQLSFVSIKGAHI